MPVVVDDFTGSNGSAWSAARWEGIAGAATSVVDIQANAGRLMPQGAFYAGTRARWQTSAADWDITFSVTFDSTSEAYFAVTLRAHSSSWGGGGDTYLPLTGYGFEYDPADGGLYVFRFNGDGSRSTLATGSTTSSAAKRWIRVQAIGSALKYRTWLDGAGEPGTWNLSTTDATHASGKLAFLHANGNSTAARTATLDDLTDNLASGSQSLTLPHISSGAALTAPTVTRGAVGLTLPHISSAATLNGPTVSQVTNLTLPHIASTATLTPPTVTPGAVTVQVPHIASTAVIRVPTVSPGAVSLAMPHIATSGALYGPTVTAGALSLTLPHIASTASLSAPTVTRGAVSLTLPHIASTATLIPPTVTQGGLGLPAIPSSAVLYPPTITVGPVTVTLPHIDSSNVLYGPVSVFEPGAGPVITGPLTTQIIREVRLTEVGGQTRQVVALSQRRSTTEQDAGRLTDG